MRYFTKQWYKDGLKKAENTSQELERFMIELEGCGKSLNIDKVFEEFSEHGRSLEQETSPAWKEFWEKTQEMTARAISENETSHEYEAHYRKIEPHLTKGIKDITDYYRHNMHDCIITGTSYSGEDFCISLEEYIRISDQDSLCSVDFANLEGEHFYLSKIIFTKAQVLKNELSFTDYVWAYWRDVEIYLHPDGYEMHIMADTQGVSKVDDQYSEIIVIFENVAIKVTAK